MPERGLIDKILAALGLNPVQWRWRLRRLREHWAQKARAAQNRSRALTYQHKVCPDCGLTVAAQEKRCPRCQRRLHSRALQRLGRLFRQLVPEGASTYTILFIMVCVAFYLAMLMRSGGTPALARGISLPVIIRYGAWTVPALADGQLWRLVTPIFLHFSLLHLIFNGLWLVQLGPLVEEAYGRSRYLFIWLATGVGGFVATVLYRWQDYRELPVPGAGASGVVFGLIGVALAATLRGRQRDRAELRSGLVKGLIYGLVFSLLPGVDLVAHLGGGLTGFGLGLVLADRQQARRAPDWLWGAVELLCLLLISGSFAAVALRP